MPPAKKRFPCGHRGLGQFCHHCDQAESRRAREEEAAAARAAAEAGWRQLFPRQAADYHRFPPRVTAAATEIARALRAGCHFSLLGGDRMQCDRRLVRFALPGFYRLVGEEGVGGAATSLRVMSHERYNRFFPGDGG